MKIVDLQCYFRSLAQVLGATGAKQVAADLEKVCTGLEPFRDLQVVQFADLLVQADGYARTGVLPPGPKSKTRNKPLDPDKVKNAAQQVLALYERSSDADLSYTTIEREIKSLDASMSKDEILELARQVGIAGNLTTKKGALESIKNKITDRKKSFERVQF